MKKLNARLAFIVFLVLGAFFYVFPWYNYDIELPFVGKEYKLGLDLQGGVELDYKIDLDDLKEEEDYSKQKENSVIEGLKRIIDKRVESLNINDSDIASANYAGEQHIIVQIPLKGKTREENDANIQRAKDAIGKVVKIEFKERREQITVDDLRKREEISNKALTELQDSKYSFFVTANQIKDNNEKVKIGTLTGTTNDLSKYFILEEATKKGINAKVLTGTGISETLFVGSELISGNGDQGFWLLENISKDNESFLTFNYIFISETPSEWKSAADSTGRILNDKYFIKSSVQYSEAQTPLIELNFNTDGAEIFGELTKRLVGEQIAIFVGGELLTSPNVNEPILNGRAVITGSYTPAEANELSTDINTGVVPAAIYLTSERSIDSKLGASSLEKLFIAGLIGFVIIYLFLIYVYRFSGVLAGIALFSYILLTLMLIKMFNMTLTLASIAGLILSIGMAIDANILIFERIKDEIRKKQKLSQAIKKGFDSSWSAIWDSNITGLIISLILYIFGINMIKGFGLMLGVGIIVSLFSAMFISRLFILLLAEKKGISDKNFIGLKK